MNRDDVELVATETPFQGYFRVDRLSLRHKRFDGGTSPVLVREIFERGHAAACLPYDPDLDRVVLLEQFRPGPYAAGDPNPWLIEAVAGIVEPGENNEEVVHREAVEEMGRTVSDLFHVVDLYPTPGGSTETIAVYVGRVDANGAEGVFGHQEEGEDIRVFSLSLDEALEWFDTGRINNAGLVVPLLWLARNRDRLRALWRAG